jgi:transposase InsO family protein
VHAQKARFPINALCAALRVSTSGYYAWCRRPPSQRSLDDARLSVSISAAFERSRGTYGGPRIVAELRDEGVRVSRKRVARLMREAGLCAVWRRKTWKPREAPHGLPVVENLLERAFEAEEPNQVWTSDITDI